MIRKHLYLITDNPDDELVGNVELRDSPRPTAKKNVETVSRMRDIETGEGYREKVVSLGYVDFESESDYLERAGDVLHEKLADIDDKHLEAAGLEPDEVRQTPEVAD